jgi:hypothetical protein
MNKANDKPLPHGRTAAQVIANTNPETHVVAVISMHHICPLTAQWLTNMRERDERDEHSVPFGLWSGVYGFVLATVGRDTAEAYAQAPQLVQVMAWARTEGYKYVMLDRDAGVTDALPIYEWE